MIFKSDSISARKKRIKLATYVGAFLASLYIILPVLWMIICSIQTDASLTAKPFNPLPRLNEITFDNYYFAITGMMPPAFQGFEASQAYSGLQIFPTLLNSLVVSISVTVIVLILGSICAYTFARIRFFGDTKLFVSLLASRLLPYISVVIPVYIIIKNIGLLDTLLSLILIYAAVLMPWRLWLLTTYFQSLPKSIEEAARIDGCSRLKTLFKIVLPLSKPGLVAVGIFTFMESFGEFIFASILTSTVASRTLPITLATMARGGLWYSRSLIMSVATLGSLIPVTLAILFRKYVIEGLTTQYGIKKL